MYSGWRLAPPEFAKKLNRIVVTKMLADMPSVSVTQSEETNMLNDIDNNETSKSAHDVIIDVNMPGMFHLGFDLTSPFLDKVSRTATNATALTNTTMSQMDALICNLIEDNVQRHFDVILTDTTPLDYLHNFETTYDGARHTFKIIITNDSFNNELIGLEIHSDTIPELNNRLLTKEDIITKQNESPFEVDDGDFKHFMDNEDDDTADRGSSL